MVNNLRQWFEEADYSKYPKEKWRDYDYMAAWIRDCGYEPKTSMENLIGIIFRCYEQEIGCHASEFDMETGSFDGTYTEACQAFVGANGGLEEFDYEL